VLRKEDNDWRKKCMEYEVVGSRPRGRPKRTWLEVVQIDCQVRGLSRDDAMVRGRWRKLRRMVDEQEECEWMNVSSGIGSPEYSRTKGRKTVVCVCVWVPGPGSFRNKFPGLSRRCGNPVKHSVCNNAGTQLVHITVC